MEKQVGDVFKDNDKFITVVPGGDCEGCVYKGPHVPVCKKDQVKVGFCYSDLRDDHISVIFIQK